MKITKFKKISKDKYKVYLEDGKDISLYEDVIINNNLLVDKKIDDYLLNDLIKQNDVVSAYSMALNFISIRIRSKKEVYEYLEKKQVQSLIIDKTVNRLVKEGYINDLNFSKSYVNDQLLLTASGPYKIKKNLFKYGIDEEIINEVFSEIDYNLIEQRLFSLINKQLKTKKGSKSMVKIKLLNYFCNLGYDKEIILKQLDKVNIQSSLDMLKKEYNKLYNKYSKVYDDEKLKYVIEQKLFVKGYTKEEINSVKNS